MAVENRPARSARCECGVVGPAVAVGALRRGSRRAQGVGLAAHAVAVADGARVEVAVSLGIRNLVAFTLPTNLGSRGVIEKAGFRYAGLTVWADQPHVLYRRSAD